jgi:hypothetical protein
MRCPSCGSTETVDLVFGDPIAPGPGEEEFEAGGCMPPPVGPETGWRHCKACGHEFHRTGMSLAEAYGATPEE